MLQRGRAALWTVRALRATRRDLRARRLHDVVVDRPPPLPRSASTGVRRALSRWPSTCLERALVLQCWLAVHGDARDVVIGVTRPGEPFGAHAWLEGESDEYQQGVAELTRVPWRA